MINKIFFTIILILFSLINYSFYLHSKKEKEIQLFYNSLSSLKEEINTKNNHFVNYEKDFKIITEYLEIINQKIKDLYLKEIRDFETHNITLDFLLLNFNLYKNSLKEQVDTLNEQEKLWKEQIEQFNITLRSFEKYHQIQKEQEQQKQHVIKNIHENSSNIDKKEFLPICSDENDNKKFHKSRSCIYKNLCLSKNEGLFINENFISLNISYSQLSTYINQGEELFWRPNSFRKFNYTNVKYRKVLLLYAPASWPQKIGFHFLLNNMFPAFRILMNYFPQRYITYPSYNNVWNYNIDLLTIGGGFAGGCQPLSNDINSKWLGK